MARKKSKKAKKPNKHYELPKVERKGKTILSLDPGAANMGIACSEYYLDKNGKGRIRNLANAVLEFPIRSLKGDIQDARSQFVQEIDRWIAEFQPVAIIAERFQSRGGANTGATGECISLMLGILTERYQNLKCKLIPASQWKNDWNKRFAPKDKSWDLRNLYMIVGTEPHQLDAMLIGWYGLELGFSLDWSYGLDYMKTQVEKRALFKLIKRKRGLSEL